MKKNMYFNIYARVLSLVLSSWGITKADLSNSKDDNVRQLYNASFVSQPLPTQEQMYVQNNAVQHCIMARLIANKTSEVPQINRSEVEQRLSELLNVLKAFFGLISTGLSLLQKKLLVLPNTLENYKCEQLCAVSTQLIRFSFHLQKLFNQADDEGGRCRPLNVNEFQREMAKLCGIEINMFSSNDLINALNNIMLFSSFYNIIVSIVKIMEQLPTSHDENPNNQSSDTSI